MTGFVRRVAIAVGAAFVFGASAAAQDGSALRSIELNASHAIVIDAASGAVLLEKNADEPIPPASLSKLMTAYMAFEALADGRLSLEDRFDVSDAAFRKAGSTMYLNLTDEPTVEELLQGIIVQSGNDATIALAEGMAGSESAFAARMTQRAREIGMTDANFVNASGLHDDAHVMSVRDLGTLARRIIQEFPEYYAYYQIREFTWAGVTQRNRNPLLYMDIGGDGMKTGFTQQSGYGIVGSAVQDGRRVIVVLAGLPSIQSRSREVRTVMRWAFREFDTVPLGQAGDVVGDVEVWIGDRARAPVALAEDLFAVAPVARSRPSRAVIEYEGPVAAPIAAGREIATLVVDIEGVGPIRAPLVAAEDIGAGGYFARLEAGVGALARWLFDRVIPDARAPLETSETAGGTQ